MKNNIKNILQYVVIFLLSAILALGLFWSLMIGINRNELRTCLKLIANSSQVSDDYSVFYVTEYENTMCQYHGIDLSQYLLEFEKAE